MATLGATTANTVLNSVSTHEGQTSSNGSLETIANADDTDYIYEGTNSSVTTTAYLTLNNMPTDFETMDTLSFQYRAFADQVTNNKTLDSIGVQIFRDDNTTALTNLSTVNYIGGLSNTTPTNSGVFSMSGLDTTAPKSVWDGARVAFTFTVSRSMGGNQDEYRISAFELTGTYTERAPSAPTSRTLSAANANSYKVQLSWNAEDLDTGAYPLPTYTIEKSTDGTNFTTHATGVSNQSSYLVTGLTNNQLYYFRITGTNASGSAVSNTASATPTELSRENTLEGGTDEDVISTNASASGPDAFNYFPDADVFYDTARASHGTVSMRSSTSGGKLSTSQAGWSWSEDLANLYIRFYLYITAYPSSGSRNIFQALETDDSYVSAIRINSTGTIALSPASRASATTTSSVATNQWVRVEALVTGVSSEDNTLRLYNSPNSTTATEEVTTYDHSSFIYINKIGFGLEDSTSYGPIWIDSIASSDAGWIGPVSTSTSFQGKLGDLTVSKMYLGDTEVTGGYLGDINLWA